MPTPVAWWLKRPSTTLIFDLRGASGSRHLPSSIAPPEPFAHQWGGLTPQPMYRAANRFGQGSGTSPATVAEPQTGTDSSQGRAMVTPTPRRNVRRDAEARSDRSRACSDALMLVIPPPV